MFAGRNESHPVVRQASRGRFVAHGFLTTQLLLVTISVAALAAASLVWATRPTVAVLGGVVALGLAVAWLRLLVRHDARALIVLWLVFLLNETASRVLPEPWDAVAKRLDDVCLALALVVVLASAVVRRTWQPTPRLVSLGLAVFAAAGVLSAVVASVPNAPLALGTWLSVKLWVSLLVAAQFSWTERDVRLFRRVVAATVVVVVAIALVQLFAPLAVSGFFGAVQRVRGGIPAMTSIFGQPSQYGTFMVLAVAVVFSSRLRPRRVAFGVLAAGFAVLSLRAKTAIDVVVVLGGRLLMARSRLVRAIVPVAVVAAGGAAFVLAGGVIRNRLDVLFGGSGDSPRQLLYRTATSIASGTPPLGSGFGTFGSEASRSAWYSPIYHQYGLDRVYGFWERAPLFIADASWATVLGEAGWLGVAGFVLSLAALGIHLWRRVRSAREIAGENLARAALLFLVTFVADSFTSPQLFAGFACVSLAVLVSMSTSAVRPVPAAPPTDEEEPVVVSGGARGAA